MMDLTPATTTAAATGLASELSGGYAFSLDGFNNRMADRLHRVQILTGKVCATEQDDKSQTLSKDENTRS